MLKTVVRALLTLVFRIKFSGLEHYKAAGERVLVIANHTSFLDGILLTVFLPDKLTFAVNTHIAKKWWARPFLRQVNVVTLDTSRPYSIRTLLRNLRDKRKVVMFPEGRITLTGTLMKTYSGAAMLAQQADATILPVAIDGPQYTPWSRLRGHVRLRWFPRFRVTILKPRRVPGTSKRNRGNDRGPGTRFIADTMAEMVFVASNYRNSLFQALLDARAVYGGRAVAAEDAARQPLNYDQLIGGALRLAQAMAQQTAGQRRVGILMDNSLNGLLLFFAAQACGRVPLMLDIDATSQELLQACRSADIHTVYSSHSTVAALHWDNAAEAWRTITQSVKLVSIEDMNAAPGLIRRLQARVAPRLAGWQARSLGAQQDVDAEAVAFYSRPASTVLVLSHSNLLANCNQLRSRLDSNVRDVVFNMLPLSSAYGLNTATLLPLFSGMKVYFYSITRPRRAAPEVMYEISASILFGTQSLLTTLAQAAHAFDFHRVRYVFAAGGQLDSATRQRWLERFGLRILEGYGKNETGPVLSINTPIEHRPGTLGRLLPGIECRLLAGNGTSGRLQVKGPNIMLGYLGALPEAVATLPSNELGAGWFDTGDQVTLDHDGFVTLLSPPIPVQSKAMPAVGKKHKTKA